MLDWASRLSRCLDLHARSLGELKAKTELYQQHLKEH